MNTERGDLNAPKDAINNLGFARNWTLDQLGNWDAFKQDDNGNSTWDLEQTRTHNLANEITGIGATTGPVWVDPDHDAAGNMTTIPKPRDLTESYTAIYDAWGRLVKLTDDDHEDKTVEAYAYSARHHRITVKTYDDGSLDETRHSYYSEQWQVLEERVNGTASADARVQYVWGLRYVDEMVWRSAMAGHGRWMWCSIRTRR